MGDDSGLAIWHADHRGSNDNQAGTPSAHYECALMQADGENDLENGEDIGDDKDKLLFMDFNVP